VKATLGPSTTSQPLRVMLLFGSLVNQMVTIVKMYIAEKKF
jgi:hypothetical protein